MRLLVCGLIGVISAAAQVISGGGGGGGTINSGTTNTLPKYTSATGIGNSSITDDGTTVTIPELLTIGLAGTAFCLGGYDNSGNLLNFCWPTAGLNETWTWPSSHGNNNGTQYLTINALGLSFTTVATLAGATGQVPNGATGAFTAAPQLGVAGTTLGQVVFRNVTSGAVTLQPTTGALGNTTLSMLPQTGNVPSANILNLTGQNGNVSATSIVSSAAAGMYAVRCYIVSTNTPTGATLPSVTVLWTDNDTGVAESTGIINTTASVSASGKESTGQISIEAQAASAIQFQTGGYAAGSGTALLYAVRCSAMYVSP